MTLRREKLELNEGDWVVMLTEQAENNESDQEESS